MHNIVHPRATMFVMGFAAVDHTLSAMGLQSGDFLGLHLPHWYHYFGILSALGGFAIAAWYWKSKPILRGDAYSNKNPWGEEK